MSKIVSTASTKIAPSTTTSGVGFALSLAWQLTAVVILPIIAGRALDSALNTKQIFLYVGFGLASIGFIAIIHRTLTVLNKEIADTVSSDKSEEHHV